MNFRKICSTTFPFVYLMQFQLTAWIQPKYSCGKRRGRVGTSLISFTEICFYCNNSGLCGLNWIKLTFHTSVHFNAPSWFIEMSTGKSFTRLLYFHPLYVKFTRFSTLNVQRKFNSLSRRDDAQPKFTNNKKTNDVSWLGYL